MANSLLSDTVAVVTGGSSGIGREICLRFAREGAAVIIADIRDAPREEATPTHEQIREEADIETAFVPCDVTEEDDRDSVAEQAAAFGGADILVNNAGIFRGEEFTDVTESEFDQMLAVNVKGVFFMTQVLVNQLAEGTGSVINLSSVAGLKGFGDFITYCASKGAVTLMTYSLADKLGSDGVRVNAIHPGVIETSMVTTDVPIIGGDDEDAYLQNVPLRRFGAPTEIASTATYLASDMSSYVNGASLVVDGGQTNT